MVRSPLGRHSGPAAFPSVTAAAPGSCRAGRGFRAGQEQARPGPHEQGHYSEAPPLPGPWGDVQGRQHQRPDPSFIHLFKIMSRSHSACQGRSGSLRCFSYSCRPTLSPDDGFRSAPCRGPALWLLALGAFNVSWNAWWLSCLPGWWLVPGSACAGLESATSWEARGCFQASLETLTRALVCSL